MLLDIRHIVGIILLFVQGLMKIIKESKDFYELERGIHELTQKVSRQFLEWTAEEMDRKGLREIATKLSTGMTFRRVAKVLSYLFFHISAMTETCQSFITDTGRFICEQAMDKIRFKGINTSKWISSRYLRNKQF